MSTPHAQMTAAQIARLAGVTRATVSNWRRRHPDFPDPAGGSPTRPLYDPAQVRAWLADRGLLPADSPVEDLKTALHRRADPGALPLWPVVLAATRAPAPEWKALAELPDRELATRLSVLVTTYAAGVPGAETAAYRASDADLVRALLQGMATDGAGPVADVLAELDAATGRTGGAYPTPPPLAALMAELVAEPGHPYPTTVLDPACGTGTLLAAAAQRGAATLAGQDLADTRAAQAAVRLGLATDATVELRVGDSLRADAFPQLQAAAVLCVPPYGVRDWGHEELAYDPRWAYGLPPKGEPELAWVQHCLAHLAEGGRAVLLLPPAVAERTAGRRIRAGLVRAGALAAVVALPAGAATPAHVGLHLWLLRRPARPDPTPPEVLFVDAAAVDDRDTGREVDWPRLQAAVREIWQTYQTDGAGFAPVPGTARRVSAMDLLDDLVDLTPARHVRVTPAARPPEEHAETARALRQRLRRAVSGLGTLTGGLPWPAAGKQPRTWRTATVADLIRGGAVTLLRPGATGDGPRVRPGDILLTVTLPRRPTRPVAVVAGEPEAGRSAGRFRMVLRPDRQRLDPWFLAGFLAAEDNLRAASTGTSIIRVDPRRLRVPLLPVVEQRRYGKAFRRLAALRTAAELASRLADEAAGTLAAGLTSGALLPPEPPNEPGDPGRDDVGRA